MGMSAHKKKYRIGFFLSNEDRKSAEEERQRPTITICRDPKTRVIDLTWRLYRIDRIECVDTFYIEAILCMLDHCTLPL